MKDAKHLLKHARWQDETPREGGGGNLKALDEDGKLAMILDGACKERGVGMLIRKMWKKRFV